MAKLSAFFLNFCLLLLALGFAPITRAETPAQSPHDFALWRRLIHRELDGTVVGGYGYEILQHGKVVAAEAKGFARAPWEKVDPSVPFTLDKLAPVASVSKTITAVALLKLWDEKKVRFSLDDPIGPILSRVAPNANPAAQRITIRQVLMHKTGFKAGADVVNRRQLADLLHRPLAYRPGAQFQYQDNNYYLARVILEQLSGESYPRYVKKHVLEPMGVTHMATRAERRQPMCGYGDTDGPRQQGFAFNWDCTRWAGGAGWWGSVDELAKFMHGLRERKVLSEKATAMLFDDALGFDWDEPGFGKGGDWVCPSPTIDGEVHSAV
ncbi:MAG TPA: serine hydrolase domain-containing protein, partial [Chthoniobacteraceae bacterium]